MQKQNNPNPPIDEPLLAKIKASKQAQGLAWKIDVCRSKEDEHRELVQMLVEKWAALVQVRKHFPDLKDVFTPDAAFHILYAHKKMDGSEQDQRRALEVSWILADISNRVARHEITFGQLKRAYNNFVKRCSRAREDLPLFSDAGKEDGRKSANKERFIPAGTPKEAPKKRATRFTVIGEYNAKDFLGSINIDDGDTCVAKPNAPYKDGDVVLMKCSCHELNEHYHARYYRACHGKKYAFKLSPWQEGGWSNAYTEAQRGIILGPVLKVTSKEGAANSTPPAAQPTNEGRKDKWPFGTLDLNKHGDIINYNPNDDIPAEKRAKRAGIIGKNFFDAVPHARFEDFDYWDFLEEEFAKVFDFDEARITFLRVNNGTAAMVLCTPHQLPLEEQGKETRIVLKQLTTTDPKFSITADGKLRITT